MDFFDLISIEEYDWSAVDYAAGHVTWNYPRSPRYFQPHDLKMAKAKQKKNTKTMRSNSRILVLRLRFFKEEGLRERGEKGLTMSERSMDERNNAIR